jgi:hydroxyacylglutathione hydrolase
MIFTRFYDDNLAQASYMIADEKSREALVVDPTADIALYLRAAGADRLRIAHVTETHIHADFVSGAASLADAAGATLHLSAADTSEWSYTPDALRRANNLEDDAEISFGRVSVRAIHTPGHTPEHLTFLVSDLARGPEPVGAFTGDFLFVGEVGRPDLLERAAGAAGTMNKAASQLFQSLQRFKSHPDYLLVWPGHGAGSACGKSLGSMPQSSVGYEKLFNWALGDIDEREFVDRVLRDQPVPPAYFAAMKKINRRAEVLPPAGPIKRVSARELDEAVRRGEVVVDTRPAAQFAEGHIPGTLNIPYNKSFLNWCGALVPFGKPVFVLTDDDSGDRAGVVASELRKIGFTDLGGFAGPGIIAEWKSAGNTLATVDQINVAQLRQADGDVQIVDVRGPEEWAKGHIQGALHIPLSALPEHLDDLDASRPVVLHCQGGGRSSIATSFLQARGIATVANLQGGYDSWVANGFEVEKPAGKSSAPSRRHG